MVQSDNATESYRWPQVRPAGRGSAAPGPHVPLHPDAPFGGARGGRGGGAGAGAGRLGLVLLVMLLAGAGRAGAARGPVLVPADDAAEHARGLGDGLRVGVGDHRVRHARGMGHRAPALVLVHTAAAPPPRQQTWRWHRC